MSEEMSAQEIAERFGVELDSAETTELDKGNEEKTEVEQQAEREQVGADAGSMTNTDSENADSENDDASNGEEGQKQTQDAQERHRQAAARREREANERKEELKRAIQQARDEVYRDQFAGQINPFTGKAITTEADYKAFMAARKSENDKKQQENVAKQFEAAGIDSAAVENMVKNQTQPIMQKMQEMQMQAAREQAKIVMQRAGEQIAAQIKVINTKYGENFSGVDDIVKGENGKEFNRFVQMGATLEQAYFLANQKAIEAKNAKSAYAAAKNAQAGKQHMNPIGAMGTNGGVEVPKAVIEMYQEFFPNATMDEIKAAYAAEINNQN